MKKLLGWVGAFVVVSLLLFCAGLAVPAEAVSRLAFGWTLFLGRTLPSITVDWAGVLMAAIAFGVFAIGVHSFGCWIWHKTSPPQDNAAAEPAEAAWKTKWTAAIVVGLILMFSAGIGIVGIAHQIGWLITFDGPLTDDHSHLADRVWSSNNLKQLGLAAHNYHVGYGSFPSGGTLSETGGAQHSWQTFLLPYLDQAPLFGRIDLRVRWNHLHNAEPFETRIATYLNPTLMGKGKPVLLVDSSGYGLSHYAANGWMLSGNSRMHLSDVTDGTSDTILAGEVNSRFKPWGDPTNWRDPAKGINRAPDGFGSPFEGGANFLFADGHVRFVNEEIDLGVLKGLGTPAGGETVQAF